MTINAKVNIRDPFILVENGCYYMYGTNWVCYKNDSGKLDGEWKLIPDTVITPPTCIDNKWAPEVHKYNGKYYMFTTYMSSVTNRRGCTILRSDSPEGPFVEISNGHTTPTDWDCIDGTLYVDEDGCPWMVFVHEWITRPDKVGSMAAAKLSPDLTHFVSEPIELFRADEPEWAVMGVTDGCFMYKTKEGKLLMIWSNFDADGYCVAVAQSDNGKVTGKWSHRKELLFSKKISGFAEGGHGMIFTALDGKMYLSLHSPNEPVDGMLETAHLVEICEKSGTLSCIL